MSIALRVVSCALVCLAPSVGWSDADSSARSPVNHSLGAGIGWVGMVHVDYSRGLREGWRVEAGLTPLLVLNVGVVGATRYVPLHSTARAEHNLLMTGTVGGIVGILDGTPAFGPGGRLGAERVSDKVGIAVTAGGLVVVGADLDVSPLPDVRLTLSRVWR